MSQQKALFAKLIPIAFFVSYKKKADFCQISTLFSKYYPCKKKKTKTKTAISDLSSQKPSLSTFTYSPLVTNVLAAPFSNMRTLKFWKFKAQSTTAPLATANQISGGASQPPTTAERAVIKSLSIVQTTKQYSAVNGSWEPSPNTWLTAAKNEFVGRALNFIVRILLKVAVRILRREGPVKERISRDKEQRALASNKCDRGLIPARRHMWVEFVVGPRFAARVFLWILLFSFLHKN